MELKIRNLKLESPFILAPMEAVNCTSFRILCKKRGAALVFTDMIDADIFVNKIEEVGIDEAIKQIINPQKEEKPLAIQIGGANIENIKKTINAVQPHADLIDFNIGCPLPYMLGKKGGSYLMKHPNQLYKLIIEMRKAITKPFSVKLRSGWDTNNINAVEIAMKLEELGVDAITIHPRTRKQKYQDKADWQLARKVKASVKIPVILSGDVTNTYLAMRAFEHTKCDFLMIGRGAKNNPSVFNDLNIYWEKKNNPDKPTTIYCKTTESTKKDFKDFLELYASFENRNNFSEIKDHAIWLARECVDNKKITQEIINSSNLNELKTVFKRVRF